VEKKLRQHLQMLLNVAAEQQAESSASRRARRGSRTKNTRFTAGRHAQRGSRTV
jgi:hypothetical protein